MSSVSRMQEVRSRYGPNKRKLCNLNDVGYSGGNLCSVTNFAMLAIANR